MTQILQINLNGCRLAQEVMCRIAEEQSADLVLITEPYRFGSRPPRYHTSADEKAAIWVAAPQLRITGLPAGAADCWTWIEAGGVRIYSCYLSPNAPFQRFTDALMDLEESIRSSALPVILTGDFNSKAPEWGSPVTNRRGTVLAEMASQLGMHAVNTGASTFVRGSSSSVLDVTFAEDSVLGRVLGWRVLDTHSFSDHLYISFSIRGERSLTEPASVDGWAARSLDVAALIEAVAFQRENLIGAADDGAGAEELACIAGDVFRFACDASMPRRSAGAKNAPVYWWNDTIAGLRRQCIAWHRRARRHPDDDELRRSYRSARKELRNAIKASKARCWREMCESVNADPWGKPYKLVRQKLKHSTCGDPYLNGAGNMEIVVDTLFPRGLDGATFNRRTSSEEDQPIPLFTEEEITMATRWLAPHKAPGPDCIPNAVIKRVATGDPELLLTVYNRCLKEGVFPALWKRQRLVLIPKGSDSLPGPSAYRPLCMLDGLGKIMERLILQRLRKHLEDEERGLSTHQYGFRPRRSTIDAMRQVVDTVRRAWHGSLKNSGHTVMIALDIKNAFNSARWSRIIEALTQMEIPQYLLRMIDSYLSDRTLIYDTIEGRRTRTVTAGVPQGSVLGPALWNAMYDGLLRLPQMEGVKIVAFADDVALLVTDKSLPLLQMKCNNALRKVTKWLTEAGLHLAVHKTEALFFTRRRKISPPSLKIDGQEITYKKSIRYLGVEIDDKLRFVAHTEKAAAKAAKTAEGLARLMPNVGGLKTARRKLYNEVVHSVLLYGAPIWADAMQTEKARQNLARVQRRSALRVAAAYRTVSEDAVLVLAAVPPIDLLARERNATYGGAKREEAKQRTMAEWLVRWNSSTKGRWTHRLIQDLEGWIGRKHGTLCFHLTQLLTGHGCFGKYLHKIGKETTPGCYHCSANFDDAAHTIFECPAWTEERKILREKLGANALSPEQMVPSMLSGDGAWAAWVEYATCIMRHKEEAGNRRRRAAHANTAG
jgi:Reverse transcriptase (RNA-dependent DNA polymerase)/Endonuclease-reverse transcriptase